MKDIMMDVFEAIINCVLVILTGIAAALLILILLADNVVNVSRTTSMPVGKVNGYTICKDVEISYNETAKDILEGIFEKIDDINR